MELNKIVGAVLLTAILAIVIGMIGNFLVPKPEVVASASHAAKGKEVAKKPEPKKPEAKKPEPKKPEAKKLEPKKPEVKKPAEDGFAARLKAADVKKGAKLVKSRCRACHSYEKDGKNKVGPNIFGVVGRKQASIAGFKYSAALKAKGGTWTPGEIDKFLSDPKKYAKGTKMTYRLKKPGHRADVIAYLQSLK